MKNKERLPLFKHTKYRWEECFAKVVLENIFPDEIKDLQIFDRPDLQNERINLGIEVTSSISKESYEISELTSKISYYEKNAEYFKERIKILGGKYDNGITIHPARHKDLNVIYGAIQSKLEKLNNDNYKIFNNNYLFIRDDNFILKEELNEILMKIKNIQENYDNKFQKIFVYIPESICVFNMIDSKSQIIEIDPLIQTNYSELARDIVEENEN